MTARAKGPEREGLIERDRRFLRVPDWEELRRVAGFSEIYLHLERAQPPAVVA